MAKRGRPTKYDPRMCARAVELGKEGKTLIQIAADLGLSKQTLYSYCEAYPDFLDAIESAKLHAQAFWEEVHQKAALGLIDVNTAALHKIMLCRFPQSYNPTIQVSRTETITVKHDAMASLRDKLDRISRRQEADDIRPAEIPGPKTSSTVIPGFSEDEDD